MKLYSYLFLLFLVTPFTYAEWLPFTLKNNHIVISLSVNGKVVDTIIDSGAEINMIDSQFLKTNGAGINKVGSVKVTGINGKQTKSLYSQVPIKLFNQDFMLNKIVEGDLFGSALLLGAPFFNSVVVQIDYPHKKLQLIPRRAVNMRKAANVPCKKQRASHLPAVKVKINNKSFWVTLDTGNNSSLFLKRSFALENKLVKQENRRKNGLASGLFDSIETENYITNNFKIGPYELENVQVSIPISGERSLVGERTHEVEIGSRMQKGIQVKGILGYDILKNFIVTIDYNAYKVHIIAP